MQTMGVFFSPCRPRNALFEVLADFRNCRTMSRVAAVCGDLSRAQQAYLESHCALGI